MKKLRITCMILALAMLLLAGCQAASSVQKVEIGGSSYDPDIQSLDLSGQPLPDMAELEKLKELTALTSLDLRGTGLTVQQYEKLTAMLPGCRILWKVPFAGDYLEPDTAELTVTSLTEEDLAALAYLPELKIIHAEGCTDPETVLALREKVPGALIGYQVNIAGTPYDGDTTALEANNADTAELMDMLRYLPELEQVSFTGIIPENDSIWQLKQAYPEISFLWEFELFGQTVSSETRELDLSGIPMESVEEVENSLKYFNGLEKVIMCDCGIPSEEMDALWKRHPETRFIWTVYVGQIKLRTDATTLMPHKHGYGVSMPVLKRSACKEMKYLVDMVCIDFGHMWIVDISFAQYMPNLEYFMVCNAGVKDISPLAGLQKLKYVELFGNPFTDVSPLATCPALEDVNLSYCKIEDLSPLLEMDYINNLWLYEPAVSEEMLEQLTQALPNTKIICHVGRSTGYGWRDLPNYFAQRDLLEMPYFTTPYP